ncbi:methyltransferase, partial [Fischerella thermalis CCMEE 5196]
MAKQYVSTAYLQQHDSKLYAIFAWSQRQAAIIPAKSWLTVMEIFVHEHSLEQAYQIFQEIKLAPTVNQVINEINKYADLLSNAIVFVADKQITIYGKGFRSFIEKDMQFELGSLSRETYQVLPQLFASLQLENDLEQIQNIEDFSKLVEKLENLGLLSPATGSLDWGDLKKTVPICQAFGLTRGTPVDRYYLRKFIDDIHPQVVGNILEVGGTPKDKDFYQMNPGSSYRILNLESGPGVDIVGDVHDVSVIEPNSLDSVIIFNVLEHCYAPWIAI